VAAADFSRLGEFAINWNNVLYVRKIQRSGGGYFEVYFSGLAQPLKFDASKPEAKALLNWWENHVSELTDGSEGIPAAWSHS